MKKLTFLLIPLLLYSCFKENDQQPRIRLKTNSPVNFNEPLNVYIDEYENDNNQYTLIHPRGIETDHSYETQNARGSDNGWYTAYSYGTRGNRRVDSIYAEVKPAPIPCSPSKNLLTTEYSNIYMNFSSITGSTGFSYEYEVKCKSPQGDLYIAFGQPQRPSESRTYISQLFEPGFNNGDHITIEVNQQGMFSYGQKDQHVYLEVDSTGMFLTLCDFEMKLSGTTVHASARLEIK